MIVLDEPTNDLDLPSLRMLEESLADFPGAVLVVSHDRYFLDRICDQIVSFEDGNVFVQPGNYSYYLEKRLEREKRAKALMTAPSRALQVVAPKTSPPPAAAPAAPQPAPKPAAASKPTSARKLSFKEQRELEGIEGVIHTAEARVAELETTLQDPAFYSTRAKEAPALAAELEAAKAEVARLYTRWEQLDQGHK